MWCLVPLKIYSFTLAHVYHIVCIYTDYGVHNSTYMDQDVKADNFYYSIDKGDTIFKVSSNSLQLAT